MIGQTVGQYRILEKLGEGGMGVVYKAEDAKLKRVVALKFLPERDASHEQDQQRFLQEAQAASALNHPNVCTIFDIQDFRGQTFIVMEYVEGKTLRDAKSSLNFKQVVDVAVQTAEGLAAAHDKGIVHRDIKTDNIMLRPDGRVQIMDFGLAKLQGVSSLSKAGTTVGTTAYMSPEQIQGFEADGRSDIFALGVVLYELLTGQLPFKGAHESAVMYEIVNVDPPSVRTVKPEVEPELDRIVMKCLEKDRDERYQSSREVVVDLKRFRRDSDGKHQPRSLNAPPIAKRRRIPWRGLVVGGAVVLVLAALGIWILNRSQAEALNSLAVLPLENASGDRTLDFISDGISESIINSLTRISSLRVVPRTTAFRFKGSDPLDVGTKLGVQAVLSGQFTREGDLLIVQVDLVDVMKQSQLWGQQYRRSTKDLLALQDEITAEASNRLQSGLSGGVKKTLSKNYTANPEAYRLYLQGLYYWNKRRALEIQKAIDCFNQAIALDPSYALAYVGLADCYGIEGQYAGTSDKENFQKVVAAASRALEIDSTLAEAHTALAFADEGSWQWQKAEQEYKTAIALNPNYPTTYHWYSILLHALGRHEEATRAIMKAESLDPLSPVIGINVAVAYELQRNYDSALREIDAVIAADSSFSPAYSHRSLPLIRLGRNDEAYASAARGVEAANRSSESLSYFGYCSALTGRRNEAMATLQELERRQAANTCPGYYLARVYSGLGDDNAVFRWLDVDFQNRSGRLMFLTQDDCWKAYRNDPRFLEIVKKMGLAQ